MAEVRVELLEDEEEDKSRVEETLGRRVDCRRHRVHSEDCTRPNRRLETFITGASKPDCSAQLQYIAAGSVDGQISIYSLRSIDPPADA